MPAMLHIASPLMQGREVANLQERLTALGYAPGPIDGAYGPTTATAVRAFQRDNQLEMDGVVGPETRKALRSARKPKSQQPVVRRASSLGAKALAEAVKHVGKKERPAGSNRCEFGKWFGVDGVPWCAIFVSFCFAKGANYVIAAGFKGAGCYRNGCTYVPTTEAWLRATGMWKGRTTPLPGDIAIFNWDGGVPDHIGIVEEYLGGGKFHSIEGNTSLGNNSNGGEVMRRVRYVSQVNGFGRAVK
jgi:Putative peptidoglycan binding domain/CHAP domain